MATKFNALVLPGGGQEKVYIYTLSCPLSGEVKYVGKTINLKQRLINHLNHARQNTKSKCKAWIKSLLLKGLKPLMKITDIVYEEWQFWEQYWICQYKAWGFSLTNDTIGGEGVIGSSKHWTNGLKGTGIIKANKGSFKEGDRPSISTEFKIGSKPPNTLRVQVVSISRKLNKIFDSTAEAANELGCTRSNLSRCLRLGLMYKDYILTKVK